MIISELAKIINDYFYISKYINTRHINRIDEKKKKIA